MPSIAEVFMRVHVDSSGVKGDIESGLNKVDSKSSGRTSGRSFGSEFAKESTSIFGRLFNGNSGGANWTKLGAQAGTAVAGGMGSALSSVTSALPLAGAVGPWGAVGIFAALVAAAPFAGQALAGGIVFGLGAGLAGIGLFAAAKAKPVKDAFDQLKTTINASLTKIGAPMVPVLKNIIQTTTGIVTAMTPVFAAAESVIAGPLKLFADKILTSFKDPAVKSSIAAVAHSFGAILSSLTPAIPGIVNGIAGGISAVAGAVSKNPGAFTGFVKFLADIVVFALKAVAWLANTATYIEQHFAPAMHRVAVIFDGVRGEIAHVWDQIYGNTVGSLIRIGHNVETQFDSVRHEIAVIFDGVRGDLGRMWNNVYNETIGAVIRIGHNVETQFDSLRGRVAAVFAGIGAFFAHWWGATESFFIGAVNAIARALTGAWNTVRGVTLAVFGAIGAFFAGWWGSTERFFFNAVHLVGRLLSDGWNAARNFVIGVFNAIGSFFAGWWGSTERFFFNAVHLVGRVLSDAWNAIKTFILSVFGDIGRFFAGWWGSTTSFFSNTVHLVGRVLGDAWDSVENKVKSAFGGIGSFFAQWWGSTERFISGAVGKISGAVSGAWSTILDSTKIFWAAIGSFMSAGIRAGEDALLTVLNGVINVLNVLISGYNAANDIWSGTNINPIKHLTKFAEGGKITTGTGPTADDVVIRVSKGETVLSAAHSDMLEKAGVLGGIGVPGFATGGQILSDATKYNHHRYVWGGASNPQTGWDCSSFVGYILGHDFGYPLPGGAHWNGSTHGPVASQFVNQPGFHMVSHNIKDILPGDLLVENSGGHVGFGVGPNQMFSAYDTASGTIFSNAFNMTNILRSTGGPGVYNGPGGTISAAQQKKYNALIALLHKDISLYSPATIARAFEKNPGPIPTGVLTQKGLLQYQGEAGNVAKSSLPAVQAKYAAAVAALAASGSPEGDPAGVGGTAGELANGKQLYSYLLRNLFGGNKIAAAGATASIWGESTWNPFAQGSGGRGLLGWTPPGTISEKDFRGGMATQLPAILRFVTSSGDSGTIAEMFRATSVLQAANEWGHGVERFGINDVHSTGLSLAKQIAGLKAGGRVSRMARGGMIAEPTIGIGASGQLIQLGENGRERVIPGDGSDPMLAVLTSILVALRAAPAATAAGVARAVVAPQANQAQAARAGAR